MTHVYARDNTEKIIEAQKRVENKHKELYSDFSKRRNEIQAMQNSFSSFDKSVKRFFEWLFDVEATVEQLENETETGSDTGNGTGTRQNVLCQKFEDIKNEIHDKDRVFNALANTGTSLTEKMAEEERTMVGRKLSEMRTRHVAHVQLKL